MEIKFFKTANFPVPIPWINGVTLFKELAEYLVVRYFYPDRIRENMTSVDEGSLRQIAYDLKMFLEALAHNCIQFCEADYHDHILPILNEQTKKNSNETFNSRHTRLRDFYDYLAKKGIRTKARFPRQTVHKRYGDSNDDFLSHTKSNNGITYSKDEGHKNTVVTSDYKDRVISIEIYGKLYSRLLEIDPVYAVMAQTMMQTFLRVSNTCEMPLHKNDLNDYFQVWPEFQRVGGDTQKYRCRAKGNKLIKIDVFPFTLQSIYEDYIQPYYQERKELFESKYLVRKNATLRFGQGRVLPEDILWLNANGTPIKPYMIEEAFRATGLNVSPHWLRHTGATHTLWNYCRLNNIEPDVRLATTFQEILQEQLGHAGLETTRIYIRTIIKLKARMYMPFAIPQEKKMNPALEAKMSQDVEETMALFFENRVKT
ncbi:hypothetical protein [Mariprofundus sp. KV]|uniref:tyrosine-type recombinase/integrase n=1 Tax=Mariprofundus sp. KV TaxID=2608715 RepID=UPI0015A2918B|nr:hypothetical protein [Mariprofundus sp. KV]NWF36668.1 hypothetical protein [Mariprofundus sp. KV]